MVELRPAYGRDGEIILYDLYIDGKWHGSRRLISMWDSYLEKLGLLDKPAKTC